MGETFLRNGKNALFKGLKGRKMAKTTQTSEYCALGHPDRVCDFIACRILDRHLERDPGARVALEVQLKDRFCTVSGEISSRHPFTDRELGWLARDAIAEAGYNRAYQAEFGRENCIAADDVEVTLHIGRQSDDIAQGVDADGWGDQGIFWGMAVDDPGCGNMPKDYHLARLLAQTLYSGGYGGIDVKTQVTVEDGEASSCIVAIPLLPGNEEAAKAEISLLAAQILGDGCETSVNGTGRYVVHGPVGDCGTTGRKLAADFYGGNCRIGGGSPWGKDPSKADVALNIYARRLALDYMREKSLPAVYCSIASCIGKREISIAFRDGEMRLLETRSECAPASHTIERLGLRKPVYAGMCARGLFGFEP